MDDDTEQGRPVSPYFRIWLCGAFRVERRLGPSYELVRATEWAGSSYPRLLLKALLCSPGQQARREALLDLLWPDADPEQAIQYLNTATTKLRKVLEPSKGHASLLLTEDDCRLYRLAAQPLLWVDVDAALTLLRAVEQMEGSTTAVSSLLEEGMTYLDVGPFLADDDGLWLMERRGEVDVACYHARLRLAEVYERQGLLVQAELQLRKLLAEDPTDEDVLCCLMELLHRHGMTHKALRAYHQFTEVAQQESLEPTEATSLLAARLRSEKQRSVGKLKRHGSDWGMAPFPEHFYGRSSELTVLKSWIAEQQCRVVALVGIGGIGKTSLALVLATQMQDTFEYVLWRSLHHAPPPHHLLQEAIMFFSDQQPTALPHETHDLIALLIESLRAHRCLLILDNVETVLQEGTAAGSYRAGYEGYGTLLQLLGEARHRSCLLLTSREKPKELSPLEGRHAPIRTLHVSGVGLVEGQALLKDKDLCGSEEAWHRLIELYAGNPLALQLVAASIREVFNANIAAFLQQEQAVVSDIHGLLDQQFKRLSECERDILYWLAIEREAISIEMLWEETVAFASKKELLDSLASLRRKSMIELSDTACFTLQPVIMEYVTDEFIREICKEIHGETLCLFARHALAKAQSKEYVRESQIRLILTPIMKWLAASIGREPVEKKFKALLSRLREISEQKITYAAGNLLNLLIQMHYDLRNYDFSHLPIRQAFLQGTLLPDVDFTDADLTTSAFTDTFGSALSVAFSPNGALLAAGTTNNDIRLWHTPSGTPYQTYQGHRGWVRAIAFSPDGRLLASGSDDQTICVWEVDSDHCLTVLQGHMGWVRAIAFSPDGRLLASGGEDQMVRLWEVSTGICLKTLQGQMGRIRAIAFSPDGHMLASGSDDQIVRLWEASTGNCLNVLRGHIDCVRSVTFSLDGRIIASGGEDQTIRLWEVSTGNCLKTLQGHTNWVWSVVFSPSGNILASGSEDQTVRLWEVNSGHCLKTLQGHTSRVRSIAVSQNGRVLVSSSEDRTMRVWDINSGSCLKSFQDYPYRVWSVALSPDGSTMVSGGEDQMVCLWDMNSGSRLKMFQGHIDRVRSVAFSSDGLVIASGSEDQTIGIWDVISGNSLNTLQGHIGRVWSVAFSPDSSIIASGGDDQTVRLWDVASGNSLSILQGHTDRIRSVAFSPDGCMLASGSEDQTVRVWEVSTGSCLTTLQGHVGRIRSVIFHPNDNFLVSSSDDGTIKFWDMYTNTVMKTLTMQKPYEGMNITGVRGLTAAQKVGLKALGAVEVSL